MLVSCVTQGACLCCRCVTEALGRARSEGAELMVASHNQASVELALQAMHIIIVCPAHRVSTRTIIAASVPGHACMWKLFLHAGLKCVWKRGYVAQGMGLVLRQHHVTDVQQ